MDPEIAVFERHVARRAIRQKRAFRIGEWPYLSGRATGIKESAPKLFAGCDQRASGHHDFALDRYCVHHNGPHADQYLVANSAAMKERTVTDSHVIADGERITPRIVGPVMGDVQYGAILNIGSRANANNLNITAHGRMWPDADIIPEMNIAHDHRSWINHDAITQVG